MPAVYCSLNAFWEVNEIPRWMRSQASTDSERLEKLYAEEVYVMHFTSLGKPWSYTEEQARSLRPNAHHLFAEQFDTWHRQRELACPA